MHKILSVLAVLAAAPAWAEAVWLQSYHWTNDHPAFGGLSGIEVLDNGTRLIAISDRNAIVTARIKRDQGQITQISDFALHEIIETDDQLDSEGIAVGAGGAVYVSYEGVHGIRQFDVDLQTSYGLSFHPEFSTLQNNSSLEALAVDQNNALYTNPERSGRADRPFPVYRLENEIWDQPFEIPRRGAFLIVGADIGPDNRFYILERDFTGI